MFFELICFVIAFPLCLVLTKLIQYLDYDVNEKKLYLLFARYWDGSPKTEKDAWICVYYLLLAKESHKQELAYVIDKIRFLSKPIKIDEQEFQQLIEQISES